MVFNESFVCTGLILDAGLKVGEQLNPYTFWIGVIIGVISLPLMYVIFEMIKHSNCNH